MSRGAVSRLPTSPRSVAMFSWDGSSGTPQPLTGQAFHHTRVGDAYSLDSQGNLYRVTEDQPRFEYDAATGLYGLLVEPIAVTNRVIRSQELSFWTASNLATVTDAAKVRGMLKLSLLSDVSGAAEGYVERTDVSMTNGQVTGLGLFVIGGTSASSQIIARDSAATIKLDSTITWTAGVPSVAVATGTFRAAISLGNGLYRIMYRLATPGATGNGSVRIIPSKTAGTQGLIYAGGVQVEPGDGSGYHVTDATTETRQLSEQYWDSDGLPRSMTVYAKYVDWGMFVGLGGNARVLTVGYNGTDTPANTAGLKQIAFMVGAGGEAYGLLNWGTGNSNNLIPSGSVSTYRSLVEMRMAIDAVAGTVVFGKSIGGDTETTASASSITLPTAWTDPVVRLGHSLSGNGFLAATVRVFPEVVSMANCRILK